MARIKFNRKELKATFLDPGTGLAKKELVLKIREDFLTGKRFRQYS